MARLFCDDTGTESHCKNIKKNMLDSRTEYCVYYGNDCIDNYGSNSWMALIKLISIAVLVGDCHKHANKSLD